MFPFLLVVSALVMWAFSDDDSEKKEIVKSVDIDAKTVPDSGTKDAEAPKSPDASEIPINSSESST